MPALFDQQDDLYALHVAKADKKSDVLANEDIHNDQGALVFKAGSRIGASEVERLLKFKLSKPLENSIAISNQLTAHSLYEELMRLIKADAQLMQLHTLCDIDNDIRECCAYFQRFEVIRQKLSILSLNLPNVFESALLAAWLGVVIAQRMNLAASVQSLFIAGLCRDIGFLHLHPELLFSDNLDPAQVRQIQAHPAIAAAALSDIKGLGSDISVMVMNHHERADGSGYPKGISEKDMLLPSQILCIADFVCEVYLARLRLHRRSLRDLLPILQIGSKAHADRCYNTLIMAIRRLQLPTNTTLHQHHAQAFIDQLMDNDRLLAKKSGDIRKSGRFDWFYPWQ